MLNTKSKILAQFIAGIFGATILGIAGFLTMIDYGGNHGCGPFTSMFGMAGYESCGDFGGLSGMIIGSIIGIFIVSKVKITNYFKIAICLLTCSFLFPLIFALIMFWPHFFEGNPFAIPFIIFMFILFSAIPSLLITAAINWRKLLRLNNNSKQLPQAKK